MVLGVIVGALAAPSAWMVAMGAGGAGDGTYLPYELLFPLMNVFRTSTAAQAISWLLFPLYGAISGYYLGTPAKRRLAWLPLAFHGVLAIAAAVVVA
ncbi:MAG: hypothetical protein WBC09_05920 [Thermoanaerobaculia bacterium]